MELRMSEQEVKALGLDAVRENREALHEIADSDLPASWVAEKLLDAVDEQGSETE